MVKFEYKRIETQKGSYTVQSFFQMMNNYGLEGWEIIFYQENKLGSYVAFDYSFTVVMKRIIPTEINNQQQ